MKDDRTITSAQAERFYDRVGRGLDRFAAFEDRARIEVAERGRFEQGRAVLEFGCGTGALAQRLLDRHLPPEARYLGIDLSERMVGVAAARLARFGSRAEVRKSDGETTIDAPDGSFDRFVSTFVIDLLSREDTHRLLAEARRVLTPDGLLCLSSLSRGETLVSSFVSSLWSGIQRLAPAHVGGCRPVVLTSFLAPDLWRIVHRRVLTMYGVPAEVVIAGRR